MGMRAIAAEVEKAAAPGVLRTSAYGFLRGVIVSSVTRRVSHPRVAGWTAIPVTVVTGWRREPRAHTMVRMTDEITITVADNPDLERFEARLDDGTVAGSAYYEREPGVVIFTHTEVDPSMEGKGIGSRLVVGALGLVRESGDKIVPLCPFVRKYVSGHPEWQDLVLQPAVD